MNNESISLDLLDFQGIIRVLLKNWWMVLLAILSSWLLATGIGKWIYVPQYTVSTTLVVSVDGQSNPYANLSTANQMATVIKEIFESDALLSLVEEDVGKKTYDEITCSQITSTNLLVLTVTSQNPREGYQFINSALKHYSEVSDYIFSNANLQILQEPSIPVKSSQTNLFYGCRYPIALLGGALMTGLIVFIYLFRNTVKSPKSAIKLLDGIIRGVIPYEKKQREMGIKKSTKALLISSSTVSMNFSESNRRTTTRIQSHLDRHHLQVLLNVSVAENEGKSTVVSNLVLSLVEKNKKVLLIDGDFRKPSLYKIFDEKKLECNPLEDYLSHKISLQEILTFNKRYGFWQCFLYHAVDDPSQIMNSKILKQLLEELKKEFDYIVIDCSPITVSTDAEIWIGVVDSCLITVRQDFSDIRTINDTVDIIWQNDCDFSGFVLNSFKEEHVFGFRRNGYEYGNYTYQYRK